MIQNYNVVIHLWEKRNEVDRPIKLKVLRDHSTDGFADVTQDQMFQSVDSSDFISLIDLTEKAIRNTDYLIIEINDFLTNFPSIGESLINTKKLKNYGSILKFSSKENPQLLDLIRTSPEVNYESLSKIFGHPVEKIKSTYRSVYE